MSRLEARNWELEGLIEEYKNFTKRMIELEASQTNLSSSLAEKQRKLDVSRDERSRLEEENDEMARREAMTRDAVSKMMARIRELEAENGELKARICRNDYHVQDMEKALKSTQDLGGRLIEANKDMKREKERMEKKIKDLQSCISRLENSNSKLEGGIAKLELEKTKALEHNRKLKRDNKSLQRNASKLKESLRKLEMQVKFIAKL